jgi:hypothetical protein
MKKLSASLLVLLGCTTSPIVHAQMENAHWVFAPSRGYDFRTAQPQELDTVQTPRLRGMATISDSLGELLFYADDHQVFNRFHQVMPGGEALVGALGPPLQGGIIIPHPGYSENYFLVVKPRMASPEFDTRVYFHLVDMSADNGLGEVILSDQVLADTACAPLTAVPHATENAWWIILHHGAAPTFLSFLLDSSGIHTEPVISDVGTPQGDLATGTGSMGFMRPSLQGDRLLWQKTYFGDGQMNRHLELFDLDPITGSVSNYRRVDGPFWFQAVEFSPSGKFAYVTERVCQDGIASHLWQYDVSSGDPDQILASKTLVHQAPEGTNTCHGAHQEMATAIDGRIYVGVHVGHHLGVITQPDLLYPDCGYIHEGLGNGNDPTGSKLPNQPRAFPKADNTSIAAHRTTGPSLHTWPNPASGQLFIQATGLPPANSYLRLFAADGRQVRTARPTGWPHALDVQGLAPGLYLLRVEGPQGSATRRVVVE